MANLEKIEYLRKKLQTGKREHSVTEVDLSPNAELQVADFLSAYRFVIVNSTEDLLPGQTYRRTGIIGYISDAAVDNIKFDVLNYLDCKVSMVIRKYINIYGTDGVKVLNTGYLLIRKADSPRDAIKVEIVLHIKHP